jgi:diaminohydroxyphosphoribosylaminopyrimidine deaminase/5-amino-6-(5-phosphoribosylamino)uracil reductase
MYEQYMRIALAQARRGMGRVSPNPMVGAVVVKRGWIVGMGYHHRAGTPHAEVHALAQAGEKARNADLYVNLEPCSHFGRTPPCADAIIASRIRKVVIGMVDPNPLVAGRGMARLARAGIEIISGVLEEECRALNQAYIKYITRGVPFVILKVASSLDGKIATASGDSRGLTSPPSVRAVHRLRDRVDAILVGIGTVEADDPLLTTRLPGRPGKDPVRVIVDSRLRISPRARVFNPDSAAGVIMATTGRAPRAKKERLERIGGVSFITADGRDGRVDLKKLMRRLGKRGISSLLIEGGTGISTSALASGIVDKVIFFYAPKIIGGRLSYGITAGEGVASVEKALAVHNLAIKRYGEDILVEGYVQDRAARMSGGPLSRGAGGPINAAGRSHVHRPG